MMKTLLTSNLLLRAFVLSVVTSAMLLLASCSKQVSVPQDDQAAVFEIPKSITLQISKSDVVLLAGNANNSAVSLIWDNTPSLAMKGIFTVQAAIRGTNFDDPINVATTELPAYTFKVNELNDQVRRILQPGVPTMIDLRVVAQFSGTTTVVSAPMALQVTAYQPYIPFSGSHVFRVPGNYQLWNVSDAPKLVAPDASATYEGYVNFNVKNPQFLLVKAATFWDPNGTYYNIGANKIGFNGNIFSLFSGSGAYRMKVDANTNIWTCTKVDSWGLTGSAVTGGSGDLALTRNESGLTWKTTAHLKKGSFHFRANGSDAIMMGHNNGTPVGVPDYGGADIRINADGNYTIVLDLEEAGNYNYSVQRNN